MLESSNSYAKNTFSFLLNNTSFKIHISYEMNQMLCEEFQKKIYEKNTYTVQSKVKNDTFSLFLNHWTNNTSPNLDSSNIYDLYLLSQEFGLLRELFEKQENQEILDNFLPVIILEDNKNKREAEKYLSHKLDYFLDNFSEILKYYSEATLRNIFYDEERILHDYEKACHFIVDNKFFYLLKSIDASKISVKSLYESILKQTAEKKYYPKIDSSLLLSFLSEYQEFKGSINELYELKKSQEKKEKKTIRIIHLFYLLFLSIVIGIGVIFSFIFCNKYIIEYKDELNPDMQKYDDMQSNEYDQIGQNEFETEIIKRLQEESDRGNTTATLILGIHIESGYFMDKNESLAVEIYQIGSKNNNPNAMMRESFMLRNGDYFDKQKSASLTKEAADNGLPTASFYYGTMLYEGSDYYMVDKAESAKYFKSCADEKELRCVKKIAQMYYDGDGIEENRREAAYYTKLASDLNDKNSTLNYTKMIKKSDGVDCNDTELAVYMKKAAEFHEDTESIYEYALMVLNGIGVKANKTKAAHLMHKAMLKDHLNATLKYGLMKYKGIGLVADKVEGFNIIKKLDLRGNQSAAHFYVGFIQEGLRFDEYLDNELKYYGCRKKPPIEKENPSDEFSV